METIFPKRNNNNSNVSSLIVFFFFRLTYWTSITFRVLVQLLILSFYLRVVLVRLFLLFQMGSSNLPFFFF